MSTTLRGARANMTASRAQLTLNVKCTKCAPWSRAWCEPSRVIPRRGSFYIKPAADLPFEMQAQPRACYPVRDLAPDPTALIGTG